VALLISCIFIVFGRIVFKGGTLGQQGGGPDSLRGFNANTIAMQIPLASVESVGAIYTANNYGAQATAFGVGVYASSARRRLTILRTDADAVATGPWVQIDRAANPMLGLFFLRLVSKNAFNRSSPQGDTAFQGDLQSPAFADTDRNDLVALFLPDVLRVDLTTGPVPLPGQVDFDRLSILGGDTTGGQASGWPNGRRPGDDVVDLVLTALASGPDYLGIRRAGDNVNANDQIFHQVFPYLATPHSGFDHQH